MLRRHSPIREYDSVTIRLVDMGHEEGEGQRIIISISERHGNSLKEPHAVISSASVACFALGSLEFSTEEFSENMHISLAHVTLPSCNALLVVSEDAAYTLLDAIPSFLPPSPPALSPGVVPCLKLVGYHRRREGRVCMSFTTVTIGGISKMDHVLEALAKVESVLCQVQDSILDLPILLG